MCVVPVSRYDCQAPHYLLEVLSRSVRPPACSRSILSRHNMTPALGLINTEAIYAFIWSSGGASSEKTDYTVS